MIQSWAESLAWLPALSVALTASGLILLERPRIELSVLALQYLFAAWLISLEVSLLLSAAKLIAGFFACGILASTWLRSPSVNPHSESDLSRRFRSFQLFAVLLVVASAWGLSRTAWIDFAALSPAPRLGAHFLLLLGLLQLGLTEAPRRVGLGLLTALSGFEIIYASLEPSQAIQALLAAVNIGIALVVSVLISLGPKSIEPSEEVP